MAGIDAGMKMGLGGLIGHILRMGCAVRVFGSPLFLKFFLSVSVQINYVYVFIMFCTVFIQKYDCLKYG
jgi:hypothetical protein